MTERKRVRHSKGTVKNFDDIQPAFMAFLYNKDNAQLDNIFKQIETASGQKRENVTYTVMGLLAVYLILGSFAQFICNLIGFAYPAYASVKAIQTEEKDDDTHWLIYWTVFAFFSLIDFFADKIMGILPLYWLAKAVFLLYLYLPQTDGALVIYEKVIDPMVTKLGRK